MSDQKLSDYLREWGFDPEAFEKRAKQSLDTARGDLSEVSGAIRQTLGEARKIVLNLQRTGGPAASELKTGFEQAWQAIENAFGRAREKVREQPASAAAEQPAEPATDSATPPEPPPPDEPPAA